MKGLNSIVEEKNIEELKRYIFETPNFNNQFDRLLGRNILHRVIVANWYEGLCFLCKVPGIDVNMPSKLAKWPPIAYAIGNNSIDSYQMVVQLLECGAKLDDTTIIFPPPIRRDIQSWIEAYQKAVAKCRRACYAVLWAMERMSPMLRDPLRIIAKMIWKSQRKRYWLEGFSKKDER